MRLVDDEDVVCADTAGDVDFFEALQQAVVEPPVGIDLALQDIVLDGCASAGRALRPRSVSMRAFISFSWLRDGS